MKLLSALAAGLVFGIGLIVAGMTNPAKVHNFLDVFGQWDPSLAFVMGGAIAIAMPGFWLLNKTGHPLFAEKFYLPTRKDIDPRLVMGSAIFGIGWGIGGLCPGPALTALPLASGIMVFVPAMFCGMWIARNFGQPSPEALTAPS